MGLRSRRRRKDVPTGGPESVIGEEHAWWAERERLQRVFVVSSEHEASEGDDGPHADFWSPESLFSYDQRDADAADDADLVINPYEVLGVRTSAAWAEVTAAHRRLAKRFHPDVLLDVSEQERAAAEEQMRRVNEAYSQLRRLRKSPVS